MRLKAAWQNRFLLFRSYLFLVVGLVSVAALLDYGFGWYQDAGQDPEARWLVGNFLLIEQRLAPLSDEERPGELARLSAIIGIPISTLGVDQVVSRAPVSGRTNGDINEAYDDQGRRLLYRHSPALDAIIQLGPEPVVKDTVAALIPPLFYLSILVVVGLWLRPLMRDLNILSRAAGDFARDYRKPLQGLDKAASLPQLAGSLEDMATRIRGLIQGQKDLTNALSHEMRTPLARIKFAMAMMNEASGVADDAEFAAIEQDVAEIEALIGTMLDYARLDQPDVRLDWQQTPVDGWLAHFRQKYAAGPITVTLAEDPQSPEALCMAMDPYLMGLAVSNLLVNACRHAKSRVMVTVRRSSESNHIVVEDDGAGIRESDYDAVFEAFTRLDDSRSRATGGYGLGLAIVARIVALHDGEVGVARAELGGARFDVTWPTRRIDDPAGRGGANTRAPV